MNKRLNTWLLVLSVILLHTSTHSFAADLNFKGKVITLITTSSPGGSTDTLARMVAQFWPKYIPGNPRVIVRNSSRGNELIDFNNLYEKGRKDGTEVGASASRIIAGEL
jgi:tripartite-type tricarboxylate transporter receptor subunit TctC